MKKASIAFLAAAFAMTLVLPLEAARLGLADIHKKKSLWQLDQFGVSFQVPKSNDKDTSAFWATLKSDSYLADIETPLRTAGFEILPDAKVELAPGRSWLYIFIVPKKVCVDKPTMLFNVEISIVQDVQAKRNEWVEFPAVTWQWDSEDVEFHAEKPVLAARIRKAIHDGIEAFIADAKDKE